MPLGNPMPCWYFTYIIKNCAFSQLIPFSFHLPWQKPIRGERVLLICGHYCNIVLEFKLNKYRDNSSNIGKNVRLVDILEEPADTIPSQRGSLDEMCLFNSYSTEGHWVR